MSKQPIQTMPEGWIFQALWKHHAEARAKGKNFVVVVVNKTNIHSTLTKINLIDKFNFYLFFFFAIVSYSHYKSLFISFFLIKKKTKKTSVYVFYFVFC